MGAGVISSCKREGFFSTTTGFSITSSGSGVSSTGSSATTGGRVTGGTCATLSLSRCFVERKTSCVGLAGVLGVSVLASASETVFSAIVLSVAVFSGTIFSVTAF